MHMHIQILLRRVLPCWCLLLAGPGVAQNFFTDVTEKTLGKTFRVAGAAVFCAHGVIQSEICGTEPAAAQ